MIVHECYRIAWSQLHDSVFEYRAQVIFRPGLTCVVEVIVEWYVKERQLYIGIKPRTEYQMIVFGTH